MCMSLQYRALPNKQAAFGTCMGCYGTYEGMLIMTMERLAAAACSRVLLEQTRQVTTTYIATNVLCHQTPQPPPCSTASCYVPHDVITQYCVGHTSTHAKRVIREQCLPKASTSLMNASAPASLPRSPATPNTLPEPHSCGHSRHIKATLETVKLRCSGSKACELRGEVFKHTLTLVTGTCLEFVDHLLNGVGLASIDNYIVTILDEGLGNGPTYTSCATGHHNDALVIRHVYCAISVTKLAHGRC